MSDQVPDDRFPTASAIYGLVCAVLFGGFGLQYPSIAADYREWFAAMDAPWLAKFMVQQPLFISIGIIAITIFQTRLAWRYIKNRDPRIRKLNTAITLLDAAVYGSIMIYLFASALHRD